MTSASKPQLTLNFEPTLPEKYNSLREFIAYRVQVQAKPAKSKAKRAARVNAINGRAA